MPSGNRSSSDPMSIQTYAPYGVTGYNELTLVWLREGGHFNISRMFAGEWTSLMKMISWDTLLCIAFIIWNSSLISWLGLFFRIPLDNTNNIFLFWYQHIIQHNLYALLTCLKLLIKICIITLSHWWYFIKKYNVSSCYMSKFMEWDFAYQWAFFG